MHYQKRFFKFNSSSRRCREWEIYRAKSEQCQPFINIPRHFQLISEMSENDLRTLGHSIGFAPTLDNPTSAKYSQLYANTASTFW